MSDQKYLQLLENLLDFDLKVLCPWKVGSDRKKPSTLFRFCFISPFVVVLLIASFIGCEWNSLTMTTMTENMAIGFTMLRSCGYSLLVLKFYDEYMRLAGKAFSVRKLLPVEPREQLMTEKYCKIEYISTLGLHFACTMCAIMTIYVLPHISPNAYGLPLNCHVFFLPLDEFSIAWELNYLVMAVTLTSLAILFTCYVQVPFLLMNQSCWLLDMASLTTKSLNEHLKLDDNILVFERIKTTNEHLKIFLERCENFVEWQNEVQDLLKWNFNLEFQIQSMILCMSIYVLSFTFSGAFIILALAVACLSQLFAYCLMGTRIKIRVDKLSYEISKNWYLMTPKQRNSLQMILHWTQNMAGFTGLFDDVSVETFQKILEASYSFFAFLRSTRT